METLTKEHLDTVVRSLAIKADIGLDGFYERLNLLEQIDRYEWALQHIRRVLKHPDRETAIEW